MHRDLKPPIGWTIIAGTLALDRTISGYLARDHDVRGRCYQRDCRRNCHIDHARIVEHGLGALKIDQVKTAMRCARLEGCGIEWLENPNRATLPLMVLRGRVAVKVRIICRGCATVRSRIRRSRARRCCSSHAPSGPPFTVFSTRRAGY